MAFDFGRLGAGIATGGLSEVAGGLFGGGGGPDFSGIQDIIRQRQQQIDAFSNKLEAARNNVLSNYQNLQTNTMKRFAGDFESALAGRGITASSGAFASGVGREATQLQAGYDTLNTQLTENNLNTIGQMQSQLFGPQMGLAENQAMLPYAQRQSQKNAIFGLLGTGAGALFGGAGGALLGKNAGQALAPTGGADYLQNSLGKNWWGGEGSPIPGLGQNAQ
jgi:hypothetical protein